MSSSRRIAGSLAYLVFAFAATSVAEVELRIANERADANAEARIRNISNTRLERVEQIIGSTGTIAIPLQIISETEADLRGVPAWVSGYAISGHIVVIPSRAVTYPNDGLEDLVLHEIAHILIDRTTMSRDVPRWFHEGVAMFAARGRTLEDRTRLAMVMISSNGTPLSAIDRAFPSDFASASRAYSVAGAFVHYLVQRYGPGVISRVLRGIAEGQSFEIAFRSATGRPLAAVEADFWKDNTIWSRWVPLLTSSLVLWILVTLLALAAIAARRRRDAMRLAVWDQEEEKVEDVQ